MEGWTGGSYIEFLNDVQDGFGHAGRIKAVCFFDGVEYRPFLVKMGMICYIIGIRNDILGVLWKGEKDFVSVRPHEDFEARKVEPTSPYIASL